MSALAFAAFSSRSWHRSRSSRGWIDRGETGRRVALVMGLAVFWAYSVRRSRVRGGFGGPPIGVALVLLGLHLCNAPWFQPPAASPDEAGVVEVRAEAEEVALDGVRGVAEVAS